MDAHCYITFATTAVIRPLEIGSLAFRFIIEVVTVGATKLDPFTTTGLRDHFTNASTLFVIAFLFIPEIIA